MKLYGKGIADGADCGREDRRPALSKADPLDTGRTGAIVCYRICIPRQDHHIQSEKSSDKSVQNDWKLLRVWMLKSSIACIALPAFWHKLPWTIAELDQALYHLRTADPELNESQLEEIALLLTFKCVFPFQYKNFVRWWTPFRANHLGQNARCSIACSTASLL